MPSTGGGSTAAGATRKRRRFGDDAPLHQPSRTVSMFDMKGGNPPSAWSNVQRAFALVAIKEAHDFGGGKGLKWKIDFVLQKWASRAVNRDDSDFPIGSIPSGAEVSQFAQQAGMAISKDDLDALKPQPKKTKRPNIVFHSNDQKKKDDEKHYLEFPLKTDDVKYMDAKSSCFTNRQIRAYCKLLNIRGRPNGLRAKLNDYVSKKGGIVARPSSPRQSNPPGDSWETWTCEVPS